MAEILSSVRFAFRSIRRQPGFSSVVIVTIAVGLASTTTIFSAVHGVLLAPIPVFEPGRLVRPEVMGTRGFTISLSIPNFRDWRERNRTFETFSAVMSRERTMTGGDRPEVVGTRSIIGDFFETTGVSPLMGRTIRSDETFEGAPAIAVVSYRFWQNRLAGADDALGRTITLDDEVFEVVGVMPESFVFPSATTEIFLPMGYFQASLCWEQRGCAQGSWALGRLKEGVTLATAQEDMTRISRELAEQEGREQPVAQLQFLRDSMLDTAKTPLVILMASVALVLLVACANVAGLLLARGEARRREVAVRLALGAGKNRLITGLLVESVTLALVGGLVGTLLSMAGIRLLIPLLSGRVPSMTLERIGLNPAVLLFTLAITVVAGLIFGSAPAWRATGSDLHVDLKEGSRGTADPVRQRLRSGIVVAGVALSFVLLAGAGLMLQSVRNLQNVDKGFQDDGIFTASISLPRARYGEKAVAWSFYERFLERVQALPGVEFASMSNLIPLSNSSWENSVIPEGLPPLEENFHSVLYSMVSLDHFDLLSVPLVRGRKFTQQDRDGAPLVAIIDETMAARFWPDEDPIGKRISWEESEESTRENRVPVYREVVGVMRNVRHYELETPSRIQVYVPMAQSRNSWSRSMNLFLRTQGDPLAMTELVRRELQSMDANLPLTDVQTMGTYVEDALGDTKVVGSLLASFSFMASLLAAVGLFGVLSFTVSRRTREIGIRMALGAQRRKVLGMVLGQGTRLAGVGIALGLILTVAVGRVLNSVLFGVSAINPVSILGAAIVIFMIALIATLAPAGRAVRVAPAEVLREE